MKETRTTIELLAKELENRKQEKLKTVLILGSNTGPLLHSKSFYENIKFHSMPNLAALSIRERFITSYEILKAAQARNAIKEISMIIMNAIKDAKQLPENTILVEMVKQNIFNTIFSFNLDDMLYTAFKAQDMLDKQDFIDFSFGNLLVENTVREILEYTQFNVCKLIRIYSNELSFIYSLNNASFQEERRRCMKQLLDKWKVKELLIVGWNPAWDEMLPYALPDSIKTIWFAHEDEQVKDDFIKRYPHSENLFYISCTYEDFCSALCAQIAPHFFYFHTLRSGLEPIIQSISSAQPGTNGTHHPPTQIGINGIQKNTAQDQYDTSPHSPSISHKRTLKADILLITVTTIETQATLDLFQGFQEISINKKIYYDLGYINDLHIALVQSPHMGSHSYAGSRTSIERAIKAVSPMYAIMVGIAFGINSNKRNIGDILVSRQIQDYDPQRVSLGPDNKQKLEYRGDKVPASPHLLDLFIAGQYSLSNAWPGEPPRVEFGLILSGSKLVDNLDYRENLLTIAPDAIGGEMEGIGLYHAASDYNVHWILVKAVCDWADGEKSINTEYRQKLAANNAAMFTRHVLQRGGFDHHRTKKLSI